MMTPGGWGPENYAAQPGQYEWTQNSEGSNINVSTSVETTDSRLKARPAAAVPAAPPVSVGRTAQSVQPARANVRSVPSTATAYHAPAKSTVRAVPKPDRAHPRPNGLRSSATAAILGPSLW